MIEILVGIGIWKGKGKGKGIEIGSQLGIGIAVMIENMIAGIGMIITINGTLIPDPTSATEERTMTMKTGTTKDTIYTMTESESEDMTVTTVMFVVRTMIPEMDGEEESRG